MRIGCILAFLGAASAHLMESLRGIPEGWHEVGKPFPEERLLLRIAMTSPNSKLFEQTLYDVSDPANERYGRHMKRDELKHMLRPTSEATASVINWLLQTGVSREAIADDGEWINFVVTIELAEKLLRTDFAIYESDRGDKKVRTLQYSVPSELHQFIDMIQPTTRFGEVRAAGSQVIDIQVLGQAPFYKDAFYSRVAKMNSEAGSACGDSVTPACLRSLYRLPDPQTLDSSINNATVGFMAFANFLEQIPRYTDLLEFQQEYAPYALGANFSWESIAGGDNNQLSTEESGEANLDSQYLQAVGWPVDMHSYNTAGRGPLVPDLDQPTQPGTNEPYLEFLNYLLAQPDNALPHTLAISYGENEQSVPEQYRRTVCNMFGQLGARGMSVVFASADTGVSSACQTNDGRNTTRFLPTFPAACPFVTSVGATTGINPERAVDYSSGGFSDTWDRPKYQDAAVSSYLQRLGNKWQGLYNPKGRAFPDVAAQGSQFHVIDKGNDTLISGTSASAPVFAGIIALINAERLKAGKKPLGFLNPFIYSSGTPGLTDITAGASTGCTGVDRYSGLQTPFVPGASWAAVQGWDPVTGLGTPNYEKLLPLGLACP